MEGRATHNQRRAALVFPSGNLDGADAQGRVPPGTAADRGTDRFHQDSVSTPITRRHPEAAIIVPPRSAAVPSEAAETAPTQRDGHMHSIEPRGSPDIAKHGRAAWQKTSRSTKRARAEAAIGRFK